MVTSIDMMPLSASFQTIDQPYRAEVNNFDYREQRDAHEESQQSTNIGNEIGDSEELCPFQRDELIFLEKQHDVGVWHVAKEYRKGQISR